MFEIDIRPAASRGIQVSAPETGSVSLLAAVLDEVDIPMLVVDIGGGLVHANRLARLELGDDHHPLVIDSGQVRPRPRHRAADFACDFAGALRGGRRRMLVWDTPDGAGAVGMVPLDDAGMGGVPGRTLLVLSRRQLCPSLTIDWFARNYALTDFEARVLRLLCAGLRPQEVAERHGVAVSTIRTQVNSIRAKTLAGSIGDLVARVARMPPMLSRYEPAA